MLLGLVLIAIGIGLAFFWSEEFLFAIKGALILGLMLLGLINVLIGLSKQKARRSFTQAMQDDSGEDAASKETPASAPQA